MTRDIKFRGKTIGGIWVYGNYAHLKKDFSTLAKGHYISNSVGAPFAFRVIETTIGQYTGFKDKTGKEIYDGDILQTKTGVAIVVWDGGAWGLKSPGSEAIDWDHPIKYSEYLIVGNIHENNELQHDADS